MHSDQPNCLLNAEDELNDPLNAEDELNDRSMLLGPSSAPPAVRKFATMRRSAARSLGGR
eukprot:gene10942-1576_t